MKKAYALLLFSSFISCFLFSQTGTIKIAKPPKKDTVIVAKKKHTIAISAGGNYTFKKTNKVGYEAEVLFAGNSHPFYFGLKYSHENQHFELSSYNTETLQKELPYSISENESDYLKIPIGISTHGSWGSSGTNGYYHLLLGLTPEYLLKTKNQYSRLNYSDFNRFNLAGTVSLNIRIRKYYSINLSYSKDFFDNLRDKNIYNESGAVVGKQKSKTNLLSLSASYYFYH